MIEVEEKKPGCSAALSVLRQRVSEPKGKRNKQVVKISYYLQQQFYTNFPCIQ
jgi:hypothetical protein